MTFEKMETFLKNANNLKEMYDALCWKYLQPIAFMLKTVSKTNSTFEDFKFLAGILDYTNFYYELDNEKLYISITIEIKNGLNIINKLYDNSNETIIDCLMDLSKIDDKYDRSSIRSLFSDNIWNDYNIRDIIVEKFDSYDTGFKISSISLEKNIIRIMFL